MKATRKKRKNSRKKKNQGTTGSLIAVLIVLILIAVFSYAYRDSLGKGNAMTETTEALAGDSTSASEPQSPSQESEVSTQPSEPSVTVVKTTQEPEITDKKPNESPKEQEQAEKLTSKKSDRETESKEKSRSVSQQIKTEEKQLFFVCYSESTESIEIVPVIRRISYEASPLTQTLNTLLYGPNVSELSRNLVTMIPDKTKILSIKIEKGIATIDFNEAFMFNSNGREGMEAQLAQIVYTATQFPTVSEVQFLIEGEKKTYLNDGSYIELPLSRSSF